MSIIHNENDWLKSGGITTVLEIVLGSERVPEKYLFTLWVNDYGVICHSLDNGRGGVSQALSNLQLEKMIPKKAVIGWQSEVIEAVKSGLYRIESIR